MSDTTIIRLVLMFLSWAAAWKIGAFIAANRARSHWQNHVTGILVALLLSALFWMVGNFLVGEW